MVLTKDANPWDLTTSKFCTLMCAIHNCLRKLVASLHMQITLGQNQITQAYKLC